MRCSSLNPLRDPTQSDFSAQLTALTFILDNKVSMTTFDANGLALLALRNGYKSGFDNDRAAVLCYENKIASGASSSYGIEGPALCLVYGKDIDLEAGVCPGSQGQHQLQVPVGQLHHLRAGCGQCV